MAGLLGKYSEHLQWFEGAKVAPLRDCSTFEECREKGLHLEINMNGAQLYESPAKYAEMVMPRRFVEILKAKSTPDAPWALSAQDRKQHGGAL